MVIDVTAILLGFFVAQFIRNPQYLMAEGLNLSLVVAVTYLLLTTNQNSYALETIRNRFEAIRRPIAALLLAALLVILYTFLTKSGVQVSRAGYIVAILFSAVGMIAGRLIIDMAIGGAFKHRLTDELLIIDGGITPAVKGFESLTVIDAKREGLIPDVNNPAMLDRIANTIRDFDRVIVSASRDDQTRWSLVLKGTGVIGEILLREENRLGAIGVGELAGQDTIVVSRTPLSLNNRIKKRLFDLAVAVPLLIALSPLLILVAILIKLDSPGPAIFKQPRVGQSNSMFQIWKFRSMRQNNEGMDGSQSTLRDDDRVTRIGRFIRATSIDELPQLINVLRGEMSIVGPRPHALGSRAGDQLFWHISPQYWMRHTLRPGITGLAQVRGFRGATHRTEDLEHRLQADLEYVNGWRLSRDITILLGTVRVLMHRDAY
ncbi:MAG: exopolysaccharide biosynthesis polyprenyl glycosylphosphotransferase [Sphingopyxis sp.]|uniref:exopolysaccharide biosynthesis polyprenyl glycosylphosphotransferase n=1 Tax=Sphingopyxis sp. TaxID=1908224 RepID=UPI002AB89D88|nr:exopolysaccharide biosynthesis polyprenyl glycosylphosphotransferase [Sphingopyxis sp.]MDZ3833670.1 exopolysaccharide biosynthesis polyprenyl glycosylphosphotransferase [Sphingopyxis sp.]